MELKSVNLYFRLENFIKHNTIVSRNFDSTRHCDFILMFCVQINWALCC